MPAAASLRQMFHYMVKQPTLAYGGETLERLDGQFVANNANMRKLLTEIATTAAMPFRTHQRPPADDTNNPPPISPQPRPFRRGASISARAPSPARRGDVPDPAHRSSCFRRTARCRRSSGRIRWASDFQLKRILAPLEPFKNRLLTLKGISNKIRGDGDGHMRGMSCLLTAIELNPGQHPGRQRPARRLGEGHFDRSGDQELPAIEEGDRDPFRFARTGRATSAIAPIRGRAGLTPGTTSPSRRSNSPYEIFDKLYGQLKDRENLGSVLDDVSEDLKVVSSKLGKEEREMLDKHTAFVRQMETDLAAMAWPDAALSGAEARTRRGSRQRRHSEGQRDADRPARERVCERPRPRRDAGVHQFRRPDAHALAGHQRRPPRPFARARHQQGRAGKAGEDQHLVRRATRRHSANKLDSIPEPGGYGTMLDNTTIVWTNELGKGNSHSHDDIPFVLLGGGLGFQTGRALQFEKVPHNRLWLSLAHAFGDQIESFGNQELSQEGPLPLA